MLSIAKETPFLTLASYKKTEVHVFLKYEDIYKLAVEQTAEIAISQVMDFERYHFPFLSFRVITIYLFIPISADLQAYYMSQQTRF